MFSIDNISRTGSMAGGALWVTDDSGTSTLTASVDAQFGVTEVRS